MPFLTPSSSCLGASLFLGRGLISRHRRPRVLASSSPFPLCSSKTSIGPSLYSRRPRAFSTASGGTPLGTSRESPPVNDREDAERYDMVVRGDTAGCKAALAAARMGAKTMHPDRIGSQAPSAKGCIPKSKARDLVEIVMPLSNVKEEIFKALDEWAAFELVFPVAPVKKALRRLRNREEWQRIIQVSKWMLSKGQGQTLATYDLLLKAYDRTDRLEDVEELWEKIIALNTRSTPKMMFFHAMSIYRKRGMLEKYLKVFEQMAGFGIKPDDRIIGQAGEAYKLLGIPEKQEKLIQKYVQPPHLQSEAMNGKRRKKKATIQLLRVKPSDPVDPPSIPSVNRTLEFESDDCHDAPQLPVSSMLEEKREDSTRPAFDLCRADNLQDYDDTEQGRLKEHKERKDKAKSSANMTDNLLDCNNSQSSSMKEHAETPSNMTGQPGRSTKEHDGTKENVVAPWRLPNVAGQPRIIDGSENAFCIVSPCRGLNSRDCRKDDKDLYNKFVDQVIATM